MFEYMSYSQIAALFLGIAFTVISIATTFLAVKYAKKLSSFIKAIFFSLTAPFIASVGWLFLIFSFIQGLRNDELLNLIISIILSLFICAMVITVAKALYNKHSALDEHDENESAEVAEDAAEQEVVEEDLAEQSEEQARIEDKKATLLLAHTPENEDEIIVDESTEVEEPTQEESEEESVEVNDTEDVTPEMEDVAPETEEFEENVEVEEPEDTFEETEEEPAQEEQVEEEPAQESEQETTEDDDSTDDDEDLTEDEEFEKFLEELRKKVEENPDGDDENK